MGSSRTSRHFIPSLIAPNSFNIGMDGTKIAYTGTLLQTLPKDKKQLIIFQIDPEYAMDSTYNGADIEALNTKYQKIPVIKENINELNKDNFFQPLFYSIAYNGKIVGIVYNYLIPRVIMNGLWL